MVTGFGYLTDIVSIADPKIDLYMAPVAGWQFNLVKGTIRHRRPLRNS